MKEAAWREDPNDAAPAMIDKSEVPSSDTTAERDVQAWVDVEWLMFGKTQEEEHIGSPATHPLPRYTEARATMAVTMCQTTPFMEQGYARR
jgi:hypothetical protein